MITFKKILIAVDNSTFSDHAAKVGFELARKFEAHVGLVHIIEPVVTPPPMADTTIGVPLQSGTDINGMDVIDVQNEVSDSLIVQVEKKYGKDLKVSHLTDFGPTAEGIINCSKEFMADMIVLGTHSRSGLDRLFMGSIAEEVVRDSAVPVMVIPSTEEAS